MTTQKGRPSTWGPYVSEWIRLYIEEKLSLGEIARRYGASTPTVHRLLHKADVTIEARPRNPNAGRTPEAQAEINARISATKRSASQDDLATMTQVELRTCERCGKEYAFKPGQTGSTYCSRKCHLQVVNEALQERTRAAYYESPVRCPCGQSVPYEKRHTAKYCSSECRNQYQAKRQPDPTNYMTFACRGCGDTVTRRKSYGQNRYCSTACSMKHTKTKQHIVVDDSTVLDSNWEAHFWGLRSMEIFSIERFDRNDGVEWCAGGWYAPDFWLPGLEIAIEIKGLEGPEDRAKWDAFRAHRRLIVMGEHELEGFRYARKGAAYLVALAEMQAA